MESALVGKFYYLHVTSWKQQSYYQSNRNLTNRPQGIKSKRSKQKRSLDYLNIALSNSLKNY